MSVRKSKFKIRPRQIILLLLILVVAALAVVVFINRDSIGEKISRGKSTVSYSGDPFTFESGSMQMSAAVKNGVALASTNGIQLLDSGGVTRVRQVYSMKTPALVSSDVQAAAFDVGGKTMCVADLNGNCTQITTDEDIITATMNENGWLAVCTEAAGYKGRVTVYNAELKAVYQWNSGEGYLLSACVSPDNKYLAAMGASEDGGSVHFFSLSSEKEQGCFISPGELFTDINWLGENRLCVLSRTRCAVIDRSGEQKGNYDFSGMYLTDYDFGGSGYVVLLLGKYRTGGTGELVSIGSDGKMTGQTELSSEVYALDANRKNVGVLCADGIKMYTSSLNLTGSGENVAGVKDIVVRSKGDVLLLSSYFAEIRSF